MSKTKSSYPEIDEIREDLNSLRTNVVELAEHVKNDGAKQTQELQKMLSGQVKNLQTSGRKRYKNLEKQVKDKPGQSMAIAFAAGLFASMLFGRR